MNLFKATTALAPLLLFLAGSGPLQAQNVKISGQIRERSEVDARALTSGAPVDLVHLLRSRLMATATISDHLTAYLEVQDARTFGQTRTIQNVGAPGFDLRQGYIHWRDIGGSPIGVRIGRQPLAYANERLIGKSDWSNPGQSYDGMALTIGGGDLGVDLMANAIARYPITSSVGRDVFLTGAWGYWRPSGYGGSIQAYYLFDDPKNDSIRQNRHTAGIYSDGKIAAFDYELDGAAQFGDYIRTRGTARMSKIAAFLVGVRAGYTFTDLDKFRIGVGYDMLSGRKAAAPEDQGEFSTLYGTNHKFYGHMDYFPPTGGLGLNDIFAQLSIDPSAALRLASEVHLFSHATDPRDLDPNASPTTGTAIGRELNLTATIKATDGLNITTGYAVFDGDRDRYLLRGRKTTQWGYVMTTVNF